MTNATTVINEPVECFVHFTVLPKTEASSSSVFFQVKVHFWFSSLLRDIFVLYDMCNIVAVMHWCFDRINKSHSNYFISMPPIGHMDWIGFRKLDPRATLITITAATTTTTTTKSISIIAAIIFIVIMERMRRN